MTESPIVLDCSVLINVLATRLAESILGSFRNTGICSAVEQETIFLRGDQPSDPRERISISALIDNGLLVRFELRTNEEELFVDLAADLDDGEAMTLAIAHHRGAIAAVDDRKARRIAGERLAGLALLRTTDIMHAWNLTKQPGSRELGGALRRIQDVARYRPSNEDPLRDWWIAAATDGPTP